MDLLKKKQLRQKRIWRIRKKVKGTESSPRLCVHFSNQHIYAQVINDDVGTTVVSLSTLNKDVRTDKLSSNLESAKKLGHLFGKKAKEAGVARVVFDRNGRLYHGAIKAFADATRKEGLEF